MNPASADPAVFDDHLDAWHAWQLEPWGRLRYAVVWHVLKLHLPESDTPSDGLRVVDVGGGDGAEAVRLAGLGHHVTIVDFSGAMLGVARRKAAGLGVEGRLTTVEAPVSELDRLGLGEFDLVLAHFVIQYLDDPQDALLRIARLVRPGGLVSLVAPNPPSEVLATAVRENDFAAAERLLGATRYHTATFDHDVARISTKEAENLVTSCGLDILGRYGGRIVMDLLPDNEPKYDEDSYAALERLELAMCGLSPYRDVGRFWQVVARRPQAAPG